MEPIVRAVDVGYGNTKFILNPKGLKVSSFPSIVAPVTANAGDHLNHGRNSKIVRVDHESYEVGPDACLARSRTHTDFLDDQFPMSFQYRALVAGALGEMDVNHVDLLILGLPQRTFSKLRQQLQNSMRGNHHVAEGRIVRVDAVLVVIQPMGAFYHWAVAEKKLRQTGFLEQRTLLIDPGYRTFDWVVMTGVKPMPELSGSVATGMSDVLGQIADGVSRAVGTPIDDLRRLDQGWRTSVTTRLFGTSYDLGPYAKAAIAIGENAIRAMIQKVGDGVDIDEIVLAGGGSFFFESIVRASFPKHTLKVLDDSMFANVRGFQILGIDHPANMRVEYLALRDITYQPGIASHPTYMIADGKTALICSEVLSASALQHERNVCVKSNEPANVKALTALFYSEFDETLDLVRKQAFDRVARSRLIVCPSCEDALLAELADVAELTLRVAGFGSLPKIEASFLQLSNRLRVLLPLAYRGQHPFEETLGAPARKFVLWTNPLMD